MMKKLFLLLAPIFFLFGAEPAAAQCNGQMAAETICGNLTGSQNFAKPTPLATLTAALPIGMPEINVTQAPYSAACDGSTDDTTAINAAIAALAAGVGGRVVIPGPCVMLGAMVFPYVGSAPPRQKPIRITGIMSDFDGTWGGVQNGGASLDMQYTGGDAQHPAKIDTRGAGMLEIDHLTIKDTSTTNNLLFLQTTNTTLNLHDLHFIGNPTCIRTTCQQDAIQFGGITGSSTTLGGTAATNGFQGYGTQLNNVNFSKIRHALNFGGSSNGISIVNITVDATCGSGETLGAPIYFYGEGFASVGNSFFGGIGELTGYNYGVTMVGAGDNGQNSFFGFGFYDQQSPTVAAFYFAAASIYNTVYAGAMPPTNNGSPFPVTAGAGAASNVIFPNYAPNTRLQYPGGIDIGFTGATSLFRGPVTLVGPSNILTTANLYGGAAADASLSIVASSNVSPSGDAVFISATGVIQQTITSAGTRFTSGLVDIGSVPRTGTAFGSVCMDTLGKMFIKITSGACL